MVYYYPSKNVLVPINSNQTDILAIPDIHDLRNYAFLYIYPNHEIEGVIRTRNLSEHYYALLPLSKMSTHLQSFESFLLDDITHYQFDEELCKTGTLQIYYSTSDLSDEDAFGYINMPSVLTDFQKSFISNHLSYFEIYQDILINQYENHSNSLTELNFMGDGTFLQVLQNLVNPKDNKSKSGR